MTKQQLLAAAGIALAGVLSLHAWQQQQEPQQTAPQPRWEFVFVDEWNGDTVTLCYARPAGCEYRHVRIPGRYGLHATASAAAQLGAQGWELVTSHPYPGETNTMRMTFRRAFRQ